MTYLVHTVDDIDGFEALKPEWDALLPQSPDDCAYLSHSRLVSWWHAYGSEGELRIATCREQSGELVAVLPLYLTSVGQRVKARSLRFVGDADNLSCGLTAFAKAGVETEAHEALAEYLLGGQRGWDVVDFNYVHEHAKFFSTLQRFTPARVVPVIGSTQRVRLPQDWESYRTMLSTKQRKTLNHAINRSKRQGDEIEYIESPSELPGALHDLWKLHEARMSTKLGESFRPQPQFREFVERQAGDLLAAGRLIFVFLRRAGKRVAVLYQFHYGDTVYGEKSGFDPEYQDVLKPLIANQMRRAIEQGFSYYDMMLGDDPYKQDWGANAGQSFAQVRVYARTLQGLLRRGRDLVAERVEGASA